MRYGPNRGYASNITTKIEIRKTNAIDRTRHIDIGINECRGTEMGQGT